MRHRTSRMRPRTNKSEREGQPKEPHVPRGDSGKDPPPVKQKPRSQWIDVRDRWEGDPTGSPGKGSLLLLLLLLLLCCAAAAAAAAAAVSIYCSCSRIVVVAMSYSLARSPLRLCCCCCGCCAAAAATAAAAAAVSIYCSCSSIVVVAMSYSLARSPLRLPGSADMSMLIYWISWIYMGVQVDPNIFKCHPY